MSVSNRYDRKARLALGALGALFVAGMAMALHNCAETLQSRSQVVAAAAVGDDDRLVKLRNGASLLLDRSSLSPKVIDWLKLETDATTAFELADSNFKPGSVDPTGEGSRAIGQVAQILKADPQLRANVIVARNESDDDAVYDLERRRAERLNSELFRQGVPANRVSAPAQRSVDAIHVFDHPGQQSRLFVVISR